MSATYLTAEQAVTMLLTNKQLRPSVVLSEQNAALINGVLAGAAHDIGCGCDDSTIAHLHWWVDHWLMEHAVEVPEARAVPEGER